MFTNGLFFAWDERKNLINQRKHGVSFAEARSVFLDKNATEYFDPDHSELEERFILLGISDHLRVLAVSYCYRKNHAILRIISARKANKTEEESYWRTAQ